MFPIRDAHRSSTIPIVNYTIIVINILIFFLQIMVPNPGLFVRLYGFTPANFALMDSASVMTIFSSMFLHGGFLHIALNLWFLHIFGDNVEDRLGHIRYALFYLASGTAAVFAQYAVFPGSQIPLIGASGAIAGVTGAYFVIFRQSYIHTAVLTMFGGLRMVKMPAWIFLGYWFVLQVFSGVGSIVTLQYNQGGVAFFAHIGGFVFGYLAAKSFYNPKKKSIFNLESSPFLN